MGQRERLVQIDVADIGAVVAGPRQSDLRVQVRPVKVNLPAMRVNDVADRANPLLEHAVRRRIRDHNRRRFLADGPMIRTKQGPPVLAVIDLRIIPDLVL
jgi:hypothetical protein